MVHAERWAWQKNRLQRRGARETLLTRYRDLLRALEPDDIDLILILPADWDATADLKPYQYNLVSKQRVKKAYEIDVVPVHLGSVRQHDWTAFFSRVNVKWCEQFGWPNRSTKGLVRVTL